MDTSIISDHLCLEANISNTFGEDRFTPTGRKLSGTHRDSRWNCIWRFSLNERLQEEVDNILEDLSTKKEFLNDIISSGGEIFLIINLPGMVNHGFALPTKTLNTLNILGIDLGIEVFPDMERDAEPHLKLV